MCKVCKSPLEVKNFIDECLRHKYLSYREISVLVSRMFDYSISHQSIYLHHKHLKQGYSENSEKTSFYYKISKIKPRNYLY